MSNQLNIQHIPCPVCGKYTLQIEGYVPFQDIDAIIDLDRDCLGFTDPTFDIGASSDEHAWCRECQEEISYEQLFIIAKKELNGENSMNIKFKKLHKNALIPERAHPLDAGYDVTAVENGLITPGEAQLVRTGLSVELEKDMELQVRSRSGLALKKRVFVLNSPGTVDAGYRNEIGIILMNLGKKDYKYNSGDRIAQFIFQRPLHPEIQEAVELENSARGQGGFGSTGK